MKYIPVDKLIAEIEELKSVYSSKKRVIHGIADGFRQDGMAVMCDIILTKITSLQQEQPTRGYDEAYLNECITKARKTWKGVDVDKYMDEMRGREHEQPDNEDIDMVAQELYEHLYELKRRNNIPTNLYDKQQIIDLWKAGVEYGRNHPKQEQQEQPRTCKTCSLFENDCPFVRGKFIPYPSKGCKDYTAEEVQP